MTSVLEDPDVRSILNDGPKYVIRGASPVSDWAIKAWCGAMGDRNPAYLDEAAAIKAGHGGILAPPVMMHSFTMPTLLNPEVDSQSRRLRGRLAALGFSSVAAVAYEQEYLKPMRIGDTLTRTVTIDGVSEAKTTALGVGHFVTQLHRITNQRDEHVGNVMMRIYYFRAETGKPRTARPNAVADQDWPITLPSQEIPVTATLVVCGALASNDYEPVHHDPKIAQNQGMQDVFMNILTSSGLAIRYVTDWGGPETAVKRLTVRLNASNYPGDLMTMTAVAKRDKAIPTDALFRVAGTNAVGKHIEAEITATCPVRQDEERSISR